MITLRDCACIRTKLTNNGLAALYLWASALSYTVTSTHSGRDKTAAIFQTTISNEFSWMEMFKFRLRFHWSLLLGFELTIFQHWFRWWLCADQATSHYLNQWWLVYWRIYASLGLNDLMSFRWLLRAWGLFSVRKSTTIQVVAWWTIQHPYLHIIIVQWFTSVVDIQQLSGDVIALIGTLHNISY